MLKNYRESSNEDRQLTELKYLTNWYEGAVMHRIYKNTVTCLFPMYVFPLLSTGAYELVRDYYIRVMELSDEELVIHELVL